MAGYRLFWKDRLGRRGDIFVRLQLECLELCLGIMHWLFFPCFDELHEFTLSLILQAVHVHLNGNTTVSISVSPSFVSSINLQWLHCPIVWIFNEDVWGRVLAPGPILGITPPVFYLQTDFVPWISTLWTCLFSQFSIHHTALLSILLPACPWECCWEQCQKSC